MKKMGTTRFGLPDIFSNKTTGGIYQNQSTVWGIGKTKEKTGRIQLRTVLSEILVYFILALGFFSVSYFENKQDSTAHTCMD